MWNEFKVGNHCPMTLYFRRSIIYIEGAYDDNTIAVHFR